VSTHALPQLLASAITVDFDLTFVAQFVLFTAFVTVLKPLLFDPLLKVFEERERRTDGAKKEAREMDAEAGDLLTRYEAELEKVRAEAGREREKLRAETAQIEAKIMMEARAEAARIIETGRARVQTEVAEMRRDLGRARPELASQIASRVLGREVSR
jgi:F-type H+-transporting ATPase subunit b